MDTFNLVLISSGISSILGLMILVLRTLFKDRLGVKLNYYIWLLLLLRLIIPPNLIESDLSMYNSLPMEIHGQINTNTSHVITNVNARQEFDLNYDNVKSTTNKATIHNNQRLNSNMDNKTYLIRIAFGIWLMGIVLLTTYILWINYNLSKRIERNKYPIDDAIHQLFIVSMKKMNIHRGVELIITDEMESASVFGLKSHKLIIPRKLTLTLSSQELKHIILHELSHIKRKDITIKWIMTTLQIIHWFNPIVWYSFYRMDQDCEVACDATALGYLDVNERREYGYTIIRLIELISRPRWIPTTMCILNGTSNIKRRIEMINIFKKDSWKWSIIGIAVFVTIGAISLTSAKSEPINFNNPILESAVRKTLEKPDGDITQRDIHKVKTLMISDDIYSNDLKNLDGIEHLTNLTRLEIFSNNLKDISMLESLESLKHLHLFCKNIDNIESISKLTNIEDLYILGNNLENLEIIESLPNLTSLHIDSAIHIENEHLQSIKGLKNLTGLTITDSYISDISFTRDHPELRLLNLMCSQITDIDNIPELKYMDHLILSGNQITDVDAIGKLTTLTDLELMSNSIVYIDSLGNLTNLERLGLSNNQIKDVSGLSSLNSLKLLDIRDNQIENIAPLGNMTNLRKLQVSGNTISDMNALDNFINLEIDKF